MSNKFDVTISHYTDKWEQEKWDGVSSISIIPTNDNKYHVSCDDKNITVEGGGELTMCYTK